MTAAVGPVTYAMRLYYDEDVRRWGFSVRSDGIVISGNADTLAEARRESLAAVAFALDSLREDGLLPADPAEHPAAAAS